MGRVLLSSVMCKQGAREGRELSQGTDGSLGGRGTWFRTRRSQGRTLSQEGPRSYCIFEVHARCWGKNARVTFSSSSPASQGSGDSVRTCPLPCPPLNACPTSVSSASSLTFPTSRPRRPSSVSWLKGPRVRGHPQTYILTPATSLGSCTPLPP